MPKLPSLTSKTVISFLRFRGFLLDHSTGSHFIFRHPITHKRASVPKHPKDLSKGTLFSILRESGFTREDLMSFLSD